MTIVNIVPPSFHAGRCDWLAEIDRRLRRQRRAMLVASGIAGCLAIVSIIEGLLLSWK